MRHAHVLGRDAWFRARISGAPDHLGERALFGLVLFGGTLGSTTLGLRNAGNAVVFSLPFYRVVFPLILRVVVVLLPALWGMQKGLRLATLPLRQAIVWAIAVAILTVLAARNLEFSVIFRWWSPSAEGPAVSGLSQLRRWQLRLLPLAMTWPVGYMVATASWQRWRGTTITG
jgi:hypothetical protein